MRLYHERHDSSVPSFSFHWGSTDRSRAAIGRRPSPILRLSGALLFDLRPRSNADGNAPRLHRLGNFPHELDLQQAILECRAFDLDVIREIESPLELARRDSLV